MALKKSELYSSLWSSCDELRGGMDASQYKDYVLVLPFIKYVSDKYAGVRVAKHGRTRTVRSGEVLVEPGDRAIPFFVVISGELEAVPPTDAIETLLLIVRAGQFTGEINILSGRS